jgi:nucleoside phosphorylase
MKNHNIVIASLPQDQYGNINSASVLMNLKRTFLSIRYGLMVGIGGGAPANKDIRLGDIVVGRRVMQYDLGKILSGGGIQRTAMPKSPDRSLCIAVTNLRASHEIYPIRVPAIIQERMQRLIDYHRPSAPDYLFLALYQHDPSMANCQGCDQSQLEGRKI